MAAEQTIILAADPLVWPYVPTVVASLLEHCRRPVFHLFLRGLHQVTLPLDLFRVIHVDRIRSWPTKTLVRTATSASMDRILAPELITACRAVYLDVDLLAVGDLSPMFEMPVGECGLAARPSPNAPFRTLAGSLRGFGSRAVAAEVVKAAGGDCRSFNAGVLVMDLHRLRRRGFTAKTSAIVDRFEINDQLACVAYSGGRFRSLEPAWNRFVAFEKPAADDRIVHWAGPAKPWSPNAKSRPLWRERQVSWADLLRRLGRPVPSWARRLTEVPRDEAVMPSA